MKTVGEQFEEWLNDPELSKFYHSRPEKIKQMIQMYPYEFYTISKYAPYGISGPGTIVELVSYRESSNIVVDVHPQWLTEDDKEHIKALCQIHGQDYKPDTVKNNVLMGFDEEQVKAFLRAYNKFHEDDN